jgi:predicted ATPase
MQPNMDELLDQVQVLEIRDFARLEVQGSPPTYIFKHNITHDVAYGTLLNEQRKQLHRSVSDGLERLVPDDVGQLAYHTFAGEDWSRALRYQEQAAQETRKLFANHQAIEHFRKALVCADELPGEETAALNWPKREAARASKIR